MQKWRYRNPSYSVVLMKPIADKLFGKESPIGKVIQINSRGTSDFVVNGVIDESAGNRISMPDFYVDEQRRVWRLF